VPKTRPGKLSVGAFVAFFACFGMFQLMLALGEIGGDTFFDNLKLSIPISLAVICAATAFFTGIFGVIRNKERGILVYLAIVISFVPLAFVIGEITTPH